MGGGQESNVVASLTSGIPIVTAVIAAITAYIVNIRLENRKSELKLVSEQVQLLYGPLMALASASDQAWTQFRKNCRPGSAFFRSDDLPTKAQIAEWRLWMKEVFFPLNEKMSDIITANAHLIEGKNFPISFLILLAHTAAYRTVLKHWSEVHDLDVADFDKVVRTNTAQVNFPSDLLADVSASFNRLKARQDRLMGGNRMRL